MNDRIATRSPAVQAHRIVMVASSFPRFPGDTVGTFMEPIARGLAGRGHQVHLVLPWHPRVARPSSEGGVELHWFKYAPLSRLNVFGYAQALDADVSLRWEAIAATPLAVAAGIAAARRVVRAIDATVVHGHWVVPGGAMAAAARCGRPLVVSLHGSDVYVAERHPAARRAARAAFARASWVTACSDDLLGRALRLGARPEASEVIPYGVDAARFAPSANARARQRARLGIDDDTPLVAAVGRFVSKKGFEYLIEAASLAARRDPRLVVVLAGGGDLEASFRARAASLGLGSHLRLPGVLPHAEVAELLAAADLVVVPSIRDDAGNVDGLPNVVLEAMATATPVVSTAAGGIGAVTRHGETAWVVPERDASALAAAFATLLDSPPLRARLGSAARAHVIANHGWSRVAERFEAVYDRAAPRGGRHEPADRNTLSPRTL